MNRSFVGSSSVIAFLEEMFMAPCHFDAQRSQLCAYCFFSTMSALRERLAAYPALQGLQVAKLPAF